MTTIYADRRIGSFPRGHRCGVVPLFVYPTFFPSYAHEWCYGTVRRCHTIYRALTLHYVYDANRVAVPLACRLPTLRYDTMST